MVVNEKYAITHLVMMGTSVNMTTKYNRSYNRQRFLSFLEHTSTKYFVQEALIRSLSDLGLIYNGEAGFGQIVQSLP